MAIHLTGEISFQDLINEFNVPKPVSLSQMYAGGAYVPTSNTGVPKSGAISLGNFYGAASIHVLDYNITADMFNFNSSTVLANSNWDGVTPVMLTVNIAAGIVVSGNNTSIPAFVVNALPSGSQVIINNNGFIIGMGGGGRRATNTGLAGGTALQTLTPITLNNVGIIGGGGGGGGSARLYNRANKYTIWASGGGGQSGRQNSTAETTTLSSPGTDVRHATGGTFAGGGAGGGWVKGGSGNNDFLGGAGGAWGAAGQPGYKIGSGSYEFTGFGAGAGGAAVVGNSLINWVSLGTIMGSRLN